MIVGVKLVVATSAVLAVRTTLAAAVNYGNNNSTPTVDLGYAVHQATVNVSIR